MISEQRSETVYGVDCSVYWNNRSNYRLNVTFVYLRTYTVGNNVKPIKYLHFNRSLVRRDWGITI